MDSHYQKSIPGRPAMPLHQLTTPPLLEEARIILQRHGCTFKEQLKEWTIFFPEGTTRTEEMFRTRSEHYRIQLPDGYILHESYDWWRDISFLQYSPK